MNPPGSLWEHIESYLRQCPSPHNTQPYRLKVVSETEAEVIFLPERGLYVADPEGRFTWLTLGIFIELARIVAHSLGYQLQSHIEYGPLYPGDDHATPHAVARLTLEKAVSTIPDLDPELILKRQTSRLPYDGSPVSPEVLSALSEEAERSGHTFETRSDAQAIKWVIELNKKALFIDLDTAHLRKELTGWLRFSEREEDLKKDGLSARCLTLNGPLLRSFFMQHWFWTLPIVRDVVGFFYGATMRGVGTIGWLRGPYVTPQDWVAAGTAMIRLWLIVTERGYYWHPYGSVITSEEARQDMINYFDLADEQEGKNMVWLLFRLGKSAPPPLSKRLPSVFV